jgi:Zn-dependent protease/CBS domain-containing protein
MRWSFKIFTVAGIGIYVHITFLLLIGFVFSVYFRQGGGALALQGTALILSVFLCVLLHELGHALTAKRFGVKAKDIVLLPIGGVARLERMPREPLHELLITVAGPLVNVAIAAVLYVVLLVLEHSVWPEAQDLLAPRAGMDVFLRQLLEINVLLVIFNMIPAFPMDGGRILRSLLAMRLDYAKATQVAASIGQGLAVLIGLFALMNGQFILLLIAVFVFLGAAGEAAAAQMQSVFRGLPVSTGMIRDFRTLAPSDTLGTAVEKLLGGSQMDFPVLEGEEILGVLTRQHLVTTLREKGAEAVVRDVPLLKVQAVSASDPIVQAWEEMSRQGIGCLPVQVEGRLAGWITSENIAEVAMVREALNRGMGGYGGPAK